MTNLTKKTFDSILDTMMGELLTPNIALGQNHLPRMNVLSRDGGYDVQLAIPGFKRDEIEIGIKNGVLTISGEASVDNVESNSNYQVREFSTQTFTRSVNLPDRINEDAISAAHKDGVLTVSLPTATETKKKLIEIT